MNFFQLRINNKYFKSSKWLYIIWPYLLLLAIHLMFIYQVQQPWLWPDEFIQLGHARYFAGGDHFLLLAGHPYAHFAYAFLLMPSFWFFSEPISIYKSIVIINAIFASALYFPLYYIFRNLFSLDKKVVAIIVFTTSIYPAFIVQSMIAWQDAVIFTFYATTIALLLYFLKEKTYLAAILFSSSLGFLYMMHARALPILIASVIFLLLLSIYRKKIMRKLLLSFAIIILFFIITRLVNSHMIAIAWQGEILPYSLDEIFRRFTSPEAMRIFSFRIFGQLLYLVQASYGLFFFGFIYLIQYIWQNKRGSLKKTLQDEKILFVIYLLFTSLAAFFAYTLFSATPAISRPDQLIYGRYNEIFFAPFFAFGLLSFYFNKNKRWQYLSIVFLLFVVSFVLQGEVMNMPTPPSPNHISGIVLWTFLSLSELNLFLISAIVLFFILILTRLFARKFIYGVFLLLLLFSLNIRVYYDMYSDLNESYLPANELLEGLGRLDIEGAYYVTGYFCKTENTEWSDFYINYNQYSYQWLLPDTRFYAFDEQAENNPEYEYVVASVCWDVPENFEVKIIKKDSFDMQNIWQITKVK